MSIFSWLHERFHEPDKLFGSMALEEAKKRILIEDFVLLEAKELAARAKRSRERNGYGEALRRALGGGK